MRSHDAFPNLEQQEKEHLDDEGGGGGGGVGEGGRDGLDGLVVAGETLQTGLDEDEAELGVHVASVALEVLADRDGLLDEAVQVFGDGRRQTWSKSLDWVGGGECV